MQYDGKAAKSGIPTKALLYFSILLLFWPTIAISKAGPSCPDPPEPIVTVSAINFYRDRAGTISDEELSRLSAEQSKPLRDFLSAIGQMSDKAESSDCALVWLDRWATAGALQKVGNEGSVTRTIALASVSVTLLRAIEGDRPCDPQKKRIVDWLHKNVLDIVSMERKGRPEGQENNVTYWAALAAYDIGMLADDSNLKDWAVGVYQRALRSSTHDGFLAREVAREKQALRYHWFGLAPLVLVRATAAADTSPEIADMDATLSHLVEAAVRAIDNPAAIERRAGTVVERDGIRGYAINRTMLKVYACAVQQSGLIPPELKIDERDWRLGTTFPKQSCISGNPYPRGIPRCSP